MQGQARRFSSKRPVCHCVVIFSFLLPAACARLDPGIDQAETLFTVTAPATLRTGGTEAANEQALTEADRHCSERNQKLQVVETTAAPDSASRPGGVTVSYRCVDYLAEPIRQ